MSAQAPHGRSTSDQRGPTAIEVAEESMFYVARRLRRGLAPGGGLGYDGAPARAARREDHRAPHDAIEALDG